MSMSGTSGNPPRGDAISGSRNIKRDTEGKNTPDTNTPVRDKTLNAAVLEPNPSPTAKALQPSSSSSSSLVGTAVALPPDSLRDSKMSEHAVNQHEQAEGSRMDSKGAVTDRARVAVLQESQQVLEQRMQVLLIELSNTLGPSQHLSDGEKAELNRKLGAITLRDLDDAAQGRGPQKITIGWDKKLSRSKTISPLLIQKELEVRVRWENAPRKYFLTMVDKFNTAPNRESAQRVADTCLSAAVSGGPRKVDLDPALRDAILQRLGDEDYVVTAGFFKDAADSIKRKSDESPEAQRIALMDSILASLSPPKVQTFHTLVRNLSGIAPEHKAAAKEILSKLTVQDVYKNSTGTVQLAPDQTISNATLRAEVFKLLKAAYTAENHHFLDAVASFDAQPSRESAQAIISQFVGPGVPTQANVADSEVRAIKKSFDLASAAEARIPTLSAEATPAEIAADKVARDQLFAGIFEDARVGVASMVRPFFNQVLRPLLALLD